MSPPTDDENAGEETDPVEETGVDETDPVEKTGAVDESEPVEAQNAGAAAVTPS